MRDNFQKGLRLILKNNWYNSYTTKIYTELLKENNLNVILDASALPKAPFRDAIS